MDNKIPEYWKNLSLENIVYFNEEGIKCVEEWRDIKGYEGKYQVSDCGRVKRLYQFHKKILKGTYRPDGYCIIDFNGIKRYRHRLVAIAFIENLKKLRCVNHKGGNPGVDIVSNLEWATHSDNTKHAFKTGLMSHKGVKNANAKLTEQDVIKIRELNLPHKQIASMFKIDRKYVSKVKNKKKWSHIN
jgi:hypothetical protein